MKQNARMGSCSGDEADRGTTAMPDPHGAGGLTGATEH
jgi:hypothetical protein